MKRLLLTTAILGASTLAASAQDLFRGEAAPDEIRASDLMGMRIYASEAALDVDEVEGPQEGWEDIGEVNDLILARDGSVEAVLVDIGGFLGLGERQTALSMDALRFVSDSATADEVGDYFLVVNASRANLEEAPDYLAGAAATGAAAGAAATTAAAATTETEAEADETAMAATDGAAVEAETATTDTAVETETAVAEDGTTVTTAEPAESTAAETEMAAEEMATEEMAATDMATDEAATDEMAVTDDMAATEEVTTDEALAGAAAGRTPISREGYIAVGMDMMTADALQGAAVYDANDERVGEVGELLIDDAGQITEVVLDVGGFLGIGEKAVALPMTSLDVLQQEGGEDLRVYVSQSREDLEGMETYAAE